VDIAAILVVIIGLIVALNGRGDVPFHPDEATYLYTSGDLELMFSQPFSMAWPWAFPSAERQTYRLLDTPLTRLIVGAGRILNGFPALLADWNWSASWAGNSAAGALPDNGLLSSARLIPALLLPASLAMVYLVFRRLRRPWIGIIAIILLASNPLILLHARRAMAEPLMIFTLSLAMLCFTVFPHRPVLLGLAAALAFNSKHSLVGVVLFGLLVVYVAAQPVWKGLRRPVPSALTYLVTFVAVTFLLNPFLWKQPVRAALAAWSARQDLLSRQVEALTEVSPIQTRPALGAAGLGCSQRGHFSEPRLRGSPPLPAL